jgi:hypothetical protein
MELLTDISFGRWSGNYLLTQQTPQIEQRPQRSSVRSLPGLSKSQRDRAWLSSVVLVIQSVSAHGHQTGGRAGKELPGDVLSQEVRWRCVGVGFRKLSLNRQPVHRLEIRVTLMGHVSSLGTVTRRCNVTQGTRATIMSARAIVLSFKEETTARDLCQGSYEPVSYRKHLRYDMELCIHFRKAIAIGSIKEEMLRSTTALCDEPSICRHPAGPQCLPLATEYR